LSKTPSEDTKMKTNIFGNRNIPLRKYFLPCLFPVLLVVLYACGSTQTIQKPLPYRFAGATLSKGVDTSSKIAVPVKQTDRFSTRDDSVYAILSFENLSGRHKVKWEWYSPDGELYYATDNTNIRTSNDHFLREATAWHRLTIKGDKAESLPGKWEVRTFFDNEMVAVEEFTLGGKSPGVIASPVAVPAVAQKVFPKDWGLIIGIEDYARLPKVDYARRDAQVMASYFNKILGVPEENIITLIDSDATRARIKGYLKKYIPANVEKETTLYVYFAGHGAPDIQKGDPYLVPFDGDTLFLEETSYRLKAFYKDIDALEINQAYVFLDSCFSGVAARAEEMLTKGARPALIKVEDVRLASGRVISLSATTAGQISNPYPKEEHGLFTYYLLKALGGKADENEDNLVTIKEIYGYVNKHVTRVARRMGSEQTPMISPDLNNLKDVSVARVLK